MVKHITIKSLEETYVSTTPESLGIADLGCSCGQNTLSTIRDMVEAIDKTTSNVPPPEYRVYLNDLPTNDFNAVFKILPDFYKQLNIDRHLRCQKSKSSVFIAGYPGSFYGRLFPDKCLHFIYSSYSLHWLSRVSHDISLCVYVFINFHNDSCIRLFRFLLGFMTRKLDRLTKVNFTSLSRARGKSL